MSGKDRRGGGFPAGKEGRTEKQARDRGRFIHTWDVESRRSFHGMLCEKNVFWWTTMNHRLSVHMRGWVRRWKLDFGHLVSAPFCLAEWNFLIILGIRWSFQCEDGGIFSR